MLRALHALFLFLCLLGGAVAASGGGGYGGTTNAWDPCHAVKQTHIQNN
uniref:Putative salivary protein n=1 Tax=Ornithodoros parkeri TaxID=140564 RepID=A6N9R7_ORNPR|nr:putative salivary protein [Ornithodoros parkeri]